MQGVPGVMARVLRALAGVGVQVHHSSDSHANISLLVTATEVPAAMEALHREFLLDTEDAPPGAPVVTPPANGVLKGLKKEEEKLFGLRELPNPRALLERGPATVPAGGPARQVEQGPAGESPAEGG